MSSATTCPGRSATTGGAGGEVWMGYQVAAQAAFAGVLIAGGPSRRGPG
ncbi:hypothetical protein ACGILS_25780 [Streptomyces albidoflavus]|nr:hypothetical protein [Streptomyces albidoflavus]MCU7707118.1 hypothetical protein [Streptomyces albidoflavus]